MGRVLLKCARLAAAACRIMPGMLLGATLVRAQPAPVQLAYDAYAAGLGVAEVQASVAITPQTYRVQLTYRLTGLLGVLFHAQSTTTVDGRFQGATAVPRELFSTGHMRGQPRVTQIDWRDGNPTVTQIIPPVEEEREPVPAAEQVHTIDSLSAMAWLLHQVAASGRCEGAMNTFDGRRLSALEAHTAGTEVLEETSRSSFHGSALRCDFEGRQLAGFIRDADQEALRRPLRGSAWFASLSPASAPVPVRMTFQTRQAGTVTMYLTQAPS